MDISKQSGQLKKYCCGYQDGPTSHSGELAILLHIVASCYSVFDTLKVIISGLRCHLVSPCCYTHSEWNMSDTPPISSHLGLTEWVGSYSLSTRDLTSTVFNLSSFYFLTIFLNSMLAILWGWVSEIDCPQSNQVIPFLSYKVLHTQKDWKPKELETFFQRLWRWENSGNLFKFIELKRLSAS